MTHRAKAAVAATSIARGNEIRILPIVLPASNEFDGADAGISLR